MVDLTYGGVKVSRDMTHTQVWLARSPELRDKVRELPIDTAVNFISSVLGVSKQEAIHGIEEVRSVLT